tara:strand:- start:194116 stop:195048 length:933 start_codon:yes stop_codon:yes gene_type:complete
MSDIKKILVKCPVGKYSIIESYEFLHELKNLYPESSIFNICEEGEKFLFDILPFDVHAFEIPPEKSSYLGIHHWIKNLHDIFNIDMYFDLEESLRSNFIAAHYKAKFRIAQENKLNKYVYTHLMKPIEGISNSDKYLNLLNYEEKRFEIPTVKGEVAPVIGIIKVEEVENFFNAKEVEPFLFFPLSRLEEGIEHFTPWKKLIESLTDHKIILWTESEGAIVDLMQEIVNERVVIAGGMDPRTLSSYFNYASGVITDDPIYASLSTYFQINSVLISDDETSGIEFKGKVLKLNKGSEVDEITDQLHDFYSL